MAKRLDIESSKAVENENGLNHFGRAGSITRLLRCSVTTWELRLQQAASEDGLAVDSDRLRWRGVGNKSTVQGRGSSVANGGAG